MDENKTQENNEKIEAFIERFDEIMEECQVLTEEQTEKLTKGITTAQQLQNGLPLLLEKTQEYNEQIDSCDRNKKMWEESKKNWQIRQKNFLKSLEYLILKLNIQGRTLKNGSIKLSTSKRTSLKFDEVWLLNQYAKYVEALQLQLPDYIKVNLTVDKNKLFTHVKGDNKMLVDNPDKIHTKETTSTSLK